MDTKELAEELPKFMQYLYERQWLLEAAENADWDKIISEYVSSLTGAQA